MSDQPLRIFVTGGRGRLASLIADHFRTPAHHVTLFSRTSGAGFRSLDDLLVPGSWDAPPTIFHLGWSSLPSTSEQHPGIEARHDLPYLDRLLGTLALTEPARRARLVFFSSGGAVYGNAPGRPSQESDPCHPVGSYGRAKLAAERLIMERSLRDGLRCTVLRISNPYGYPVPSNRAQGLIPHALRCIVSGQSLSLWGDGSARKDFLYYPDFLSALESVLQHELPGIFNLCAGESHTVGEVIRLIEGEVGRSVTLQPQPAPSWDVHDSRLSNAKFIAATGWRPQVPLAEGIRRAAAGYATH